MMSDPVIRDLSNSVTDHRTCIGVYFFFRYGIISRS